MSKFVLSLHSDIADHNCLQQLSRFAHSAIQGGHQIDCIFLYQDAVNHASQYLQLSSDELNVQATWQALADLDITLLLCVTAAEKRAIDVKNTGLFKVAGLAEFAMLSAKADKWVQFK
ncbi:Putative sulfurtransferase DsrE [Pseudoalteromonas holothuriae]|uniref:Sulfurtransferase DsrE n=1 Tax=Pseudoalteromonas holothuriae TaxID=2963714 RepID=A0A9W4VS17_9GAMM|nr:MULTISPECIES: sulfurtransferase complex subunit TusD [unclassified Pseudoalteromonas]CAH9060345.1 Putative sulfurtransferase DsrE [Pseudoalteromonas sp. CIP111951]CAH9060519.1 Putative sulfurtransferase DsrE [Pseudoalteromonas sp. CIP111854]